MSKIIFIVTIIFFVSNICVSQVLNGDSLKSSPILKPVLHTTKSHTLKRKKSKKQPIVKSEPKKNENKPTKKAKPPVAKVDVVKETKTVETAKVKKKEKEPEVSAKTNTVAAVVLPESSVPIFKGGKKAMDSFISQNLIYPNNADKNGIRGKIEFSCIVTKDGKLKDVKMIKALGFGCNEEALRLVKLMPDWDPGRANNQAVDMPAVFSITFKN